MANAPFVVDEVRTAIAKAYTNEAMIADMILPRAPVAGEQFKWTEYNKEDRFTIPDTMVDRKGELNQVEFGGTEQSAMTNDYGLSDVIPTKDIENARQSKFDLLGNATELLSELLMLDRERNVATMLQDSALYPHKETLGATDKWDHADGNPIDQISDAMEVPWMRPNVMVINPAAALALRKNPTVIKAYNGTLGDSGLVPLSWIETLLDIQIVVGRAKYNSAKPGQTMVEARLWSNNAILFYRNTSAMPNKGLTFGLTAQYGNRVAARKQDDDVGLRGATVLKVGESRKELVLAADCAYFIEGVTA